jgi:hypothetical protein
MTDQESGHTPIVAEQAVLETCGEIPLPRMGVVEQRWETDPITDPEARAGDAVGAFEIDHLPDGGSIAVGVGSRGIAELPAIVRGVVGELSARGYEPFVFPAMGSHGGATAEGQREKLAALGVTENSVGCPIRATMEVVEVGRTPERDVPVYADAHAIEADAIVPVNRIKPHTDFGGEVESGLSKMLVIGMGKQRGAQVAHRWAVDWSFRRMIPEITELLLGALPVIGGVAIVEDERDEPTRIEGIPPSGFLEREAELLRIAYERLPTFPFDEIDVLVVDRIGKDVSGPGMDTNVIGRMVYGLNEPEPATPEIKRIFARSLTEPSHGNAVGLGNADFVHADLYHAMDHEKTLINALTASTPRGARVPPVVESDRAGVSAALSTIGVTDPESVRLVRVTDTMHLKRLVASEALLEEARDREDLDVVREATPIAFEDGQFAAEADRGPQAD